MYLNLINPLFLRNQLNMWSKILIISILVLTILSGAISTFSFAQPQISLAQFATGFSSPVDIANAGDSRMFIVEQAGYIYIVDSSGNVNGNPFLNIVSRVTSGGEQGLLGLAFHPNYASNGFFYVNYTGVDSTHISRFSVSISNPDSADLASEVKLLSIYQPFNGHNGGCIKFGPDGYLYIGMGDGGNGGDPGDRAQDSLEFLGKILRIDVDGGSPYAIPASNPFIGNPSALNEIWALGLRNPWRFSFDRSTGDLWIADVGQGDWEEIDFQPAVSSGGENYGWRCYEGNSIYNAAGCTTSVNYTFPIHEYSHLSGNCSVTGGYVYRGPQFSNLKGHYFFSDHCSDIIWTIYDSSGTWVTTYQGQFSGNIFSTFGEDVNGELYIAGLTSGIIYRIEDTTTTGTADINDNGKIKIYPNPFSTSTTIVNYQLSNSNAYTFILYDLLGREVKSVKGIRKTTFQILRGDLAEGLYIYKLYAGDGMIGKGKIVISD